MKKRFLFGLVAVPLFGVCLLAVQGCNKKEATEQKPAPEVKIETPVVVTPGANTGTPIAVAPEAKTGAPAAVTPVAKATK